MKGAEGGPEGGNRDREQGGGEADSGKKGAECIKG